MNSASQEKIIDELQKFVAEGIVDRSVKVKPELSFHEMGIDSVAVIQIVLFIERKFSVVMKESDLTQENLRSIQSLSEFIVKRV